MDFITVLTLYVVVTYLFSVKFNVMCMDRYPVILKTIVFSTASVTFKIHFLNIWNTWSGFEVVKPVPRLSRRLHHCCTFPEPFYEIADPGCRWFIPRWYSWKFWAQKKLSYKNFSCQSLNSKVLILDLSQIFRQRVVKATSRHSYFLFLKRLLGSCLLGTVFHALDGFWLLFGAPLY